jgi:hypothetical protein
MNSIPFYVRAIRESGIASDGNSALQAMFRDAL